MSFLNPGLLGSRHRFNDRFVRPVEEGEPAGEKSAAGRLGDIIAPFILRRRKSEVLTELPPKDESIIRCEMTDEQAAAYDSMRGLYRRQVSGLLSSEGLNRSRVEIFTIISKLRLLAIHPPLAGEPFAGIEGGKMAAMDRLLEEIMDEDHKTLLFSQFLGALDRAESTCRRQNWDFSRLTGSTKDREEPIRRFNEDPERRIFLLSLKAGGVGINLTAADYVMLLDPWWNPAVEAQAVDRAHRMGQKRPVMVYRLITSGTIEERVLDLQERKKNLIAGVLGDEPSGVLNEEQIMNLFE
jgi:SNF2 family DNA or RNA helicase